MLSDAEGEAIRKGVAEGWRGQTLLRWLEQLLQDHEERLRLAREREEARSPDPSLRQG